VTTVIVPWPTCMTCGGSLVWEADRRAGEHAGCTMGDETLDDTDPCWECDGVGTVHDCGGDVCPCADPDEADQVTCPNCSGTGRVHAD